MVSQGPKHWQRTVYFLSIRTSSSNASKPRNFASPLSTIHTRHVYSPIYDGMPQWLGGASCWSDTGLLAGAVPTQLGRLVKLSGSIVSQGPSTDNDAQTTSMRELTSTTPNTWSHTCLPSPLSCIINSRAAKQRTHSSSLSMIHPHHCIFTHFTRDGIPSLSSPPHRSSRTIF